MFGSFLRSGFLEQRPRCALLRARYSGAVAGRQRRTAALQIRRGRTLHSSQLMLGRSEENQTHRRLLGGHRRARVVIADIRGHARGREESGGASRDRAVRSETRGASRDRARTGGPGGALGDLRLTPRRSRSTGRIAVLLAFVLAMVNRPLPAHERSESFSHWTYASGHLSGTVTVRAREVTRLTLPGEGYGSLTPIFAAHLEKTVAAAVDGKPCTPLRPPQPLESEAGYIRIGLEMRCSPGESLDIRVGAFFDVAPSHRHFIYPESAACAPLEAILPLSWRRLRLQV